MVLNFNEFDQNPIIVLLSDCSIGSTIEVRRGGGRQWYMGIEPASTNLNCRQHPFCCLRPVNYKVRQKFDSVSAIKSSAWQPGPQTFIITSPGSPQSRGRKLSLDPNGLRLGFVLLFFIATF